MDSLQKVLDEIRKEREYQDAKFGVAFDDKNTLNDWATYITRYVGNAAFTGPELEQRRQLLKVAALAVAALQAFDRNGGKFPPRHYDH